MSQLPSRALELIFELARELSPVTLAAIASQLELSGPILDRAQFVRFGGSQRAQDRLAALADIASATPALQGSALAIALKASVYSTAKMAAEQLVEIAWTGPATEAVPVRRVDQALYELVEEAQQELLLVTYAAYKAERALGALRSATHRGVRVSLVLELANESGGKISFDGLEAVRTHVPKAKVFYWPLRRRGRNDGGGYGSMHAKCLLVDRKAALVSSANLTDRALELNIELGLLVRGSVPARLAAHFDQLIAQGELSIIETSSP